MGDEVLRDGRYRIVGKLGEGAQGTTFDAVDTKTGAAVAIKRFSVRGAKSWKDVELAEREATVLETLSHPALPGHVEHFEEDGALYLVMQKIEGRSLAQLTAKGGALSRDDVMRFLGDAASVLDYLHGRSPPVIHRDINPKNFIRRPDGSFALVDFGAVRDRLKPEGGSTIVGTFGYMAPEQLQGRALPATDVYSVGATALRLLTGREPETLQHRGLAIDVNAALGAGDHVLRDVLTKMLDPDPDRRASKLGPLLKRLEQADRGSSRRPEPRDETRAERARDGRNGRGDQRTRPAGSGREAWDSGAWDFGRDAESWGRDVGRQARARARDEYRKSRGERRRAQKQQRRDRRSTRRGRPLDGPPLVLSIVGLNVAIVVVGLALGVVVPAVLVLLSILFGRPLRDAARATRGAGEDARRSMMRARDYLLHGPNAVEDDARDTIDVDAVSSVDDPPRPRTRVRVEPEVVDTSGAEPTSEPVESADDRRAHR